MAGRRKKKTSPLPLLLGIALALVGLIVFCLLGLPRLQQGAASTEPPQTTAPAAPEPRANTWDPEGFYRQGELLRYEGGRVGIDVSAHQGLIRWPEVAAAGVEFAILRCGLRGSTVGELYVDDTFYENLEGARAAGLDIGVYFFSQALNEAEALEEAEFVCRLLEGLELELPVYYDFERVSGESRVPGEHLVPMTDCALAFCRRIEEEGYRAGVYFNQNYGYYYFDLSRLEEYSLWLAEYDPVPSFAYHFDCLQYSAEGRLPGISTVVDLNLLLPES